MTTATGLDPIKIEFVKHDDYSPDDLEAMRPMAPNPGALDDISQYDGTAGWDPRPDFVKQDDENIRKGHA